MNPISSAQRLLDIMASSTDLDDMTEPTNNQRISNQLRDIIEASGESRYEIAKQTGIDQSALSRFMSGERGLSMTVLDTLADYLELDIVSRRRTVKARLK